MNKKLEEKLYKKYPSLFKQKYLPMSQTAMCWNIQCGDGWYALIDSVCSCLQFNMRYANIFTRIQFNTVKEKMGGLRLYYDIINDKNKKPSDMAVGFIDGIIDLAESLSFTICETCGKPGKLYIINNWYMTCCQEHMKQQAEYIKKEWRLKKVKIIDCSKEPRE